MAPELPVLEIAYVDVTIGNATYIPLVCHYACLFLSSGRDANFEATIAWKGRARDTSTADRFGNFAAKRAPGANVIFGQHPEQIFSCLNLARELPDSWALLSVDSREKHEGKRITGEALVTMTGLSLFVCGLRIWAKRSRNPRALCSLPGAASRSRVFRHSRTRRFFPAAPASGIGARPEPGMCLAFNPPISTN